MTVGELSDGQRAFLDHLVASELVESLYLSGGTALAAFHLHHRNSEDLDLFSRHPIDGTAVVRLVTAISEREPIPHRIHHRLGFIVQIAGAPGARAGRVLIGAVHSVHIVCALDVA